MIHHYQSAIRFFWHSQDEDLLYVLLREELRIFDLGDRPGEGSTSVETAAGMCCDMVNQLVEQDEDSWTGGLQW